VLEAGIGGAEGWIYVVIGVLLVVAGVFTIVGTITDLIRGSRGRPVTDSGVFVLDRVLLMFIIAELLYTLRLVDFGGRILVEPFLFIGLIAVVRRILVVTAQAEGALGHRQVTDVLLQLAALGGLALILALSIHVLRGSSSALEPEPSGGPGGPG
jgi:uncharacterized membrane protein (DUF373 family)